VDGRGPEVTTGKVAASKATPGKVTSVGNVTLTEVAPEKVPPATSAGATRAQATAPVAAEPAQQRWWESLLVDLIMLALVIFVPSVSALAFLLLRKLGIKVDLQKLDSIATSAASYAEHRAKAALKSGLPPTPGAQKEKWAWELVDALDAKLKLKDLARDKLRLLIMSKIPAAEAEAAVAVNTYAYRGETKEV
jgi:hypothetical protein